MTISLPSYEKLGLFYLGKAHDLHDRLETPVLYDSKDLLTHAVCVGMTGSGKTGLGITVIEEAALDGVPVLAIDPKGDLANLLLTFPSLSPSEFLPWIDAAAAQTQGTTVEALAAAESTRWRDGLAAWQEDGDRIARLRAAAEVRVYTPGSRAATPLALLSSLRPAGASPDDEDAAAQITSVAAGLLALAGIDDAAAHSREQTLLATILAQAPAGSADLPWLVGQIQKPPFDRVGVLDLETFYPARDRQELALRFNNILAAPGFATWLSGEPLDVGGLLFTPHGKPRVAIVSIAHLGDAERMLVVSLLLNAVLSWTRRQSGTSSLRALIYMDEVFGYLPPVANPPSKLPLLTLLKQARAFGVGVMLATQNPVDLDYKALSNMGTWFLGKLQTERDKARMLDGIESIGIGVDRATLERTLSSLRSRVFFMHNVHDERPTTFETRWTLSYLRGPMTREELRRTAGAPDPAVVTPPPLPTAPSAKPATIPGTTASTIARPVLPAGIRELFMPGATDASALDPVLYGSARVHYTDARRGLDVVEDVQVVTPFSAGAIPIDWAVGEEVDIAPESLQAAPPAGATFAALPPPALDPKRYAPWQRSFEQWCSRQRPLQLFAVRELQVFSRPGESERDFRARVVQAVRERRDAMVDKLRGKYAAKIARLTERANRAQDALAREEQQASQQKVQTVVSVGATMLGALLGRAASLSSLGRATTAARGVSRSMKEAEDVTRAQGKVEDARAELAELQAQLEAEIAALPADAGNVPIETVEVKPKRGAVEVRLVALVWRQ